MSSRRSPCSSWRRRPSSNHLATHSRLLSNRHRRPPCRRQTPSEPETIRAGGVRARGSAAKNFLGAAPGELRARPRSPRRSAHRRASDRGPGRGAGRARRRTRANRISSLRLRRRARTRSARRVVPAADHRERTGPVRHVVPERERPLAVRPGNRPPSRSEGGPVGGRTARPDPRHRGRARPSERLAGAVRRVDAGSCRLQLRRRAIGRSAAPRREDGCNGVRLGTAPRTSTLDHIAKLAAWATVFAAPDQFGVELPEAEIDAQTVLATIDPGRQVGIAQFAAAMGKPTAYLVERNPALRHGITHPRGPHRLIVDAADVPTALAAIERQGRSDRLAWQRVRVLPNDTLEPPCAPVPNQCRRASGDE